MRTEAQIQDRIARLIRENDTLRQQAARALLSENPNDHRSAEDLMDRARHGEAMARALDWVLDGVS
jgi:hypothetical protein